MKYINAEKVKAEIKRLQKKYYQRGEESDANHDGNGKYWGGVLSCLNEIHTLVESMEQEQPAPPGIEEEEKKQGWLDYGLTVGEIGLHRYNAIQRIREHKEKFDKRDIPSGILYHVAEYYEAVGMEKAMCCLQAWCRDFRFTPEDVREIIRKEE